MRCYLKKSGNEDDQWVAVLTGGLFQLHFSILPPSKNACINAELVPILALGIIIMELALKKAVHITTPFILEKA